MVSKRYPNNNNLNNNNITTTNSEKDAVVAVDFKKIKEKGEERMRVIRERMVELDFKEEFVEKILKEYSTKKIDEKLDLLMERKNIQSPAGWLSAALKNDYQDEEQESQPIPHPHLNPPPSKGEETRRMDSRARGNDIKGSGNDNFLLPSPLEGEDQGEGDKILSTEEARERFHSLREQLMAMS